MNHRQTRGRINRCGMPVRPTYGAEYPCPYPAHQYGMCSQHVKATARKIAKLGIGRMMNVEARRQGRLLAKQTV